MAMDANGDTVSASRETRRVRQQVPDNLLEPGRIPHQRAHVIVEVHDEIDFLGVDGGSHGFDCGLDDHAEIDELHVEPHAADGGPRHVEQIVHELAQCVTVAAYGFRGV